MECDFRAIASAPFNASNTIKDSSLNDVGLDGRASGCPGAPELILTAAILPRRSETPVDSVERRRGIKNLIR